MNKQKPNIKFPFDIEQNNSFSFLDIQICHENNKYTSSVYRKPTFINIFFNSPLSSKFGLVNALLFRCFNLCGSFKKIHFEIVF